MWLGKKGEKKRKEREQRRREAARDKEEKSVAAETFREDEEIRSEPDHWRRDD